LSDAHPKWWATGLLLENCNCTVVCPGHFHFSQPCTHEVCRGYWALRVDEGEADGLDLSGMNAVIVYESPQIMIDGGWTQGLFVSDASSEEQRRALETIVSGAWGGPWEVLARFVTERLPTRAVPILIEEQDETPVRRSVSIPGILRATVEALRGRDRTEPVLLENIFNQIHDSRQIVARGTTEHDGGRIVIRNEGTHGLWSTFRWSAG
jgi:hypothetical protein